MWTSAVVTEMIFLQGSVLPPLLFKVYLEEALRFLQMQEQVRKHGDLLAFEDNMLLKFKSKVNVEEIISELGMLELSHNFRMNKKKSEILTAKDLEEIAGVKCKKTVKNLGVVIATEKLEPIRIAKE